MAIGLKLAQGPDQEIRVALAADTGRAVTFDLLTGQVIWITPTITSADLLVIVPATWWTDAGGITMDIYGAAFVAGSKANFEGTQLITVQVDATHLIALVPNAMITRAGVYAITVTFGGTPGPAYLTVIERTPQSGRGRLLRPSYDLLGYARDGAAADTMRDIGSIDRTLRRIGRN